MTTYVIAQCALQIALNGMEYGTIEVWANKYKLSIYYDCLFDAIEIKRVEEGIYLSNNLTPSTLPEEFNFELFQNVIIKIMKERLKEIKHQKVIDDKLEKERNERERLEREQKDWEETKEYLNDTFGLY